MKKSINIHDNVNLIFNTYTFFFETAADNLYVVGQLLPCKTSMQGSADGGWKNLKSALLEIPKNIMAPKRYTKSFI